MRRVHYQFPHDQDVMALLVEALMMHTVRKLWNLKTGTPAPNSDVLEVLGICERAIASGSARPALRGRRFGTSDKPSDYGSSQRQTQRDVPRHRYAFELR
jgi:hypothetical protein